LYKLSYDKYRNVIYIINIYFLKDFISCSVLLDTPSNIC